MNYNTLKDVTVVYLKLRTRPGSSIIPCIMEGVSIAFNENIPVMIVFNNVEYLIHPQDIVKQIITEGLKDE